MDAFRENLTLNYFLKHKVVTIILIVIFILSIVANGVQGYFMYKKTKAYRVLEAVVENKSNCEVIPAAVETPAEPAPTTNTPTKRKSSTPSTDEGTDSDTSPIINPSPDTSTPEVVIPPPPPPSD